MDDKYFILFALEARSLSFHAKARHSNNFGLHYSGIERDRFHLCVSATALPALCFLFDYFSIYRRSSTGLSRRYCINKPIVCFADIINATNDRRNQIELTSRVCMFSISFYTIAKLDIVLRPLNHYQKPTLFDRNWKKRAFFTSKAVQALIDLNSLYSNLRVGVSVSHTL